MTEINRDTTYTLWVGDIDAHQVFDDQPGNWPFEAFCAAVAAGHAARLYDGTGKLLASIPARRPHE